MESSPAEEFGETDTELELDLDEQVRDESSELRPDVQARILLDEMLATSGQHRTRHDAKLRALVAWIKENLCPLTTGADWERRRVIIFTEYGDTLRYLKEQLTAAFEGTERGDERILSLTGGLGDEGRAAIQRAFNGDLEEHPVRVLLATDAAREGINLQGHCADLFHYDVPWNPSRLEQRNGRIDRALQPEKKVRCGYFLYTQRAEDAVLDTLARKVDVIARELGSLGSVLMDQMAKAMSDGIRADTKEAVENAAISARADIAKQELETQRTLTALKKELDAIGEITARSRKVMDFDSALLRDALDVGFELSGAQRMSTQTVKEDGKPIAAWKMPALPDSWSRTLDSIRYPREKDETPWDWRKRPLRSVVFEAPARISSELAHLHLSHPIVQRVLQRYLAQGFSANDLSRVTVVRTKRDSVARVIVFGRLSLFGAGAARLHDEVVSVSAKWLEAEGKGHLKPFGDEADRKAIEQLELTLAEAPDLSNLPEAVQKKLLKAAPGDFAKLWPAVEEESARHEKDAKKKLVERGDAEAKALRKILETQQEAIAEVLDRQLDLELVAKEEIDQFKRDKGHLEKRRAALEKELREQPEALKQIYEVRLARLSPVGMVYLWPSSR